MRTSSKPLIVIDALTAGNLWVGRVVKDGSKKKWSAMMYIANTITKYLILILFLIL